MKEKWTYEKCKEIALQFKTRKELKETYYQVHYKIYKERWYELLSHMERQASKTSRCVYYYRFKSNAIYVGLTCNHKKRDIQHRQCGPVYEYSLEHKEEIPKMVLLTEYINYEDAAKVETEIIDKLSANNDITLLNRERGGGLGTWNIIEVSKEQCMEDIDKCSSKTELRAKYYPSYVYLLHHWDEMGEKYKNFFLANVRFTKVVSFTSDGNFYKEFHTISAAIKECGSKLVSEACRGHFYTNGYYFMYYQDWIDSGKPLKVLSQEEKNELGRKNTILHRNENYKKYGNPQTGKKKPISSRIKKGLPVIMADLNNNFIDVFPAVSFAIEKYGFNENLSKCIHKVRDNPLKSAYGYRWYTIDFFNKTFNKNIVL